MSQMSERAEQIWSGWSKFGVGGTNLEWVEQIWSGWSGCGQNSMCMLVFFVYVGFHVKYNIEP